MPIPQKHTARPRQLTILLIFALITGLLSPAMTATAHATAADSTANSSVTTANNSTNDTAQPSEDTAPGVPTPPTLDGVDAAYLINLDSGTVICSKEPDRLLYPASTAKLMAAYVALSLLSDRMSEVVTITQDMIAGTTGTRYGLADGETVTIEDLFYIAFAGCYNDAVMALARLASGDLTSFISAMNTAAGELGMESTHYTNPTGMHDRLMRTTAADVARLATELQKNDFYLRMTSEPKYTLRGSEKQYTVGNRNELVMKTGAAHGKYYNSICQGMNVGMTEESGYALTTRAEDDGTTYICVILGGREDEGGENTAYTTANALIAWAYENFSYREVITPATLVAEIPVTLATDADSVLLIPETSFSYYLPNSAVIGKEITYTQKLTVESLEAPVSAGVACGFITVSYLGEEIATLPLVTKASVSGNRLLKQMEEIREFSQSRVFIATVISAVIITILYYALRAFLRASHRKKRGRYY